MLRIFLLVITLSLPIVAFGFDVEGYTTGMSRSAVVSKSEKYYRISTLDDGTIMANGQNGDYFSFNFCEDRLVAVQQGFQSNLRQVTLIVSEFKSKYGNPFSTNAGTKAHSSGTVYEWGMWWNTGKEFANLYFAGSEQGDSLSTSHQSKNKCFKVPR